MTLLAEGALLQIDITKAGAAMNKVSGAAAKVPAYKICLEEVDELAAALFKIGSRNPIAFLPYLKDEAKTFVNRNNLHLKAGM